MLRRYFLAVTLTLAGWLPGGANAPSRAADDGPDLQLVAVGVLENSAERNGHDTYVIRDGDGQTVFRVATAEGTDLKPYLGQRVEVVGRLESGSDLRRRTIFADKLTVTDKSVPAHFVDLQADSAKPAPKSTTINPKSVQVAPAGESPSSAQPSSSSTTPMRASVEPLTGPVLVDPGVELTEEEVREMLQDPAFDAGSKDLWGGGLGTRSDSAPSSPGWVWGDIEYLLWSIKGMRVPPLVTTSPDGTPAAQAGVLGAPGTAVLFGDTDVFDGGRDGLRLRLGGWLGARKRMGLAFEYFTLEDQSQRYDAGSAGVDIIARPFNNVDPSLGPAAGPTSRLISYPDLAAGTVQVSASNSLESFAAILRGNVLSRGDGCNRPGRARAAAYPGFRLDLLSGYRYLGLDDRLVVRDLAVVRLTDQRLGGSSVTDSFVTSNDFQGGEIGLQGEYYRSRWGFDGLVKLALGRTRERVDIRGTTVQNVGGVVTTYDEGLLALDTNIGSYTHKQTDVLLELGLTVGYFLAQNLQVTCGYTVIYWPHVVRAGDQIDLDVNGSYLPTSPGPPAGPAQPALVFQETSLWAQGLSLGLDYRW